MSRRIVSLISIAIESRIIRSILPSSIDKISFVLISNSCHLRFNLCTSLFDFLTSSAYIRTIKTNYSMFAVSSNKPPLEEFDDVKKEMEQFSLRFNNLILEKKSAVVTSKQQHTSKINDLERRAQKLRDEIESQQIKKQKTVDSINLTLSDLRMKQVKVDGLTKQLESLRTTKENLQREVELVEKDYKREEELLVNIRQNLNDQVAKDMDELTKFEMYLGLKIEAVDVDLLRFRFANVDAQDIDREVLVELFVGDETYKVRRTQPALDQSRISQIEADFNQHGDFVVFLKTVRVALREAM